VASAENNHLRGVLNASIFGTAAGNAKLVIGLNIK
jgi:hypothetical protein